MKEFLEVRIHGRGGQGSVTAAELIAMAVFYEGKYSQAFPNFGVERRGAPVEAFARISDQPIRLRSQIYQPDIIIVQDPTLIGSVDLFAGLKKNGLVIINTEKTDWPELKQFQVITVPVTKLAVEIIGRPVTNTGLLAAFAKATKAVNFDSLIRAVKEKFADKPDLIDKNILLMEKINQL